MTFLGIDRTLYPSLSEIQFQASGTGAVQRDAQSKMRDIVSVKDFGAVGDGVTDDTAAIQAALNTGYNIFVPGTSNYYLVSTTLSLLDYQHLFGEGERSQIRQTTSNANVVTASNRTGCVVENVNLYAHGSKDTLITGCGILFNSCTRVIARGNLIQNHRGGGVTLNNTNEGKVSENTFVMSPVANSESNGITAGDILLIRSSSRNVVVGNLCKSGNGVGIYVQTIGTGESCNDNAIVGNVIQDCKAYGIMVYRNEDSPTATEHVKGNSITGNTVRNTTGTLINEATGTLTYGAGIYVQGAEDTVVSGNTVIQSHQGAGPFAETLAPGAIGCTNVTRFAITGNVIQDCDMFGIDIRDVNAVGGSLGFGAIIGNTITNCLKSGINVRDRARIMIQGNTVDTTALSGIRVHNMASKEQISVVGNTVRNTTGTANIEINYADGIVVTGNNCDTGSVSGITAANSIAPLITNNIVKNHTIRGIQILNTSSQANVFGNYIEGTGSSSEGIRFDAATRYANNDISGCTSVYAGAFAPFSQLTVNSTTPSVEDGERFLTSNTIATTISNFTNGYDGQEILVVFVDANTTLDFTVSNLKGNAGGDRAMAAGDAIQAIFRASGTNVWYVTILDTTA